MKFVRKFGQVRKTVVSREFYVFADEQTMINIMAVYLQFLRRIKTRSLSKYSQHTWCIEGRGRSWSKTKHEQKKTDNNVKKVRVYSHYDRTHVLHSWIWQMNGYVCSTLVENVRNLSWQIIRRRCHRFGEQTHPCLILVDRRLLFAER